MATTRINIDTKGKNVLELFMSNMNELSAINKLSAGPGDANTYDGNGGEVNVTWPRAGIYNNTGKWPAKYQRYFVREINIPQDEIRDILPDGAPLSPAKNDGTLSSGYVPLGGTADSFAGKSPRTLEYTDNPYNATGAVGWGRGKEGSFIATKGRKSLYTLLQETWGAFFDGNRGPVFNRIGTSLFSSVPRDKITNKDSDNYNSYDYKYMDNQGRSFVDPPSGIDFVAQALMGFNLGQTLGGNITIEDRLKTQAQNITRGLMEDMAAGAGANDNEFIRSYYDTLIGAIAPAERISQLYVPGWGRPSENWLTKKPLSENLNQNLLLPPNSGEVLFMNPTDSPGNTNDNGAGIPGFGNTEATFQSLYTRNRSGKAGGVNISNPLFNNGMIAGTAINSLQEPSGISTNIIKGIDDPPKSTHVPFTFKDDDAQYLTYPKKETGFTSNGPTTSTDPSRMEPAVNDFTAMAGDVLANLGRDTVRFTQGQHFPFAFSTVNKKSAGERRFQVCYLQAVINSLSETYTPTWNARHFFGRTEQAHTYTFTDRTIDIGFTVFANEMRQLQNVYERVVWLAQQCYPDYDLGGRMSEGPIIAMRVGDLFQYKAGIIRSLSYDWMFNGGRWEVTSGMRMPQGCNITMSYQVIHDHIPHRSTDFYGGPAGGLQSAVQRSRRVGVDDDAPGNAYSPFEDDNSIDSIGFGEPLIAAGVQNNANSDEDENSLGERSFLQELIAANSKWREGDIGDIRTGEGYAGQGDLQVPVADSNSEPMYV